MLREEAEFEEELLRMIPRQRNAFNSLVSTRKTEGFLIN